MVVRTDGKPTIASPYGGKKVYRVPKRLNDRFAKTEEVPAIDYDGLVRGFVEHEEPSKIEAAVIKYLNSFKNGQVEQVKNNLWCSATDYIDCIRENVFAEETVYLENMLKQQGVKKPSPTSAEKICELNAEAADRAKSFYAVRDALLKYSKD